MRHTWFGFALAGAATVALTGCAQTMVNSGPSSVAPAISWTVQVLDTSDTKNVSGSGTITVPRGTMRVYIHAKSPSGVKTVTDGQFIDAGFSCISGDVGQSVTATFAGGTQSQSPNAQNKVDEDLVLFQVFGTGYTCQQGFDYQGGSMAINAKATNFGGKQTSATLKIILQ